MKKTILLLFLVLLTGCNNNSQFRDNKQLCDGDKILYECAISDIKTNNRAAIDKLSQFELKYPKSSNLPEVMILKIYALYKDQDYHAAVRQAEKFISLYPRHQDTAYAYYIKGMCSKIQIMDSQRDQTITEEAILAFDELERQFPDSRYAKSARKIVNDAKNILAVKQIEIGRSYSAKGEYGAAADRYQFLLEKYPNTLVESEAIYRMIEVHINLNAQDYAEKYLNRLKKSYPNSTWTNKAMQLIGDTNQGSDKRASPLKNTN